MILIVVRVAGASSDNLKGLFDMLPILRTGEAIIVGEAVSLPIRTLIDPPDTNRRPDSGDPRVVVRGDANILKATKARAAGRFPGTLEDYAIVMRQWRSQSPHTMNTRNRHKSAATKAGSNATSGETS
jgi:hypothetical protein